MDLYNVLGVSSTADTATIERAFRKLSLKMHPDKANATTKPSDRVETPAEKENRERSNHEKFVQLINARDILTDPKRREEYDLERAGSTIPSEFSRSSQSRDHYPSSNYGSRSTGSGSTMPSEYSRSGSGQSSYSSRTYGSRTSVPRPSQYENNNVAAGRLFVCEWMRAELLYLCDELNVLSARFHRIGPRPGSYDREWTDLSTKFTTAIDRNLDLVVLIRETRTRLLDLPRMPPDHRRRVEYDASRMITSTWSHIRRVSDFIVDVNLAFAPPPRHSRSGDLLYRLRRVFDCFREQWSAT